MLRGALTLFQVLPTRIELIWRSSVRVIHILQSLTSFRCITMDKLLKIFCSSEQRSIPPRNTEKKFSSIILWVINSLTSRSIDQWTRKRSTKKIIRLLSWSRLSKANYQWSSRRQSSKLNSSMKVSSQQQDSMVRCDSTCGLTKPMTLTHSHHLLAVKKRKNSMSTVSTLQFSRMISQISSSISLSWSLIEGKLLSVVDTGMERFVFHTLKKSLKTNKTKIGNSHS